jgi:CheY-like chemotaxis protein
MNSPGLSDVIPLPAQEHRIIEIIDALQNLLYLIRLDASKSAQVTAYAEHADALVVQMQRLLAVDGNMEVPVVKTRVLVIDDEPSVVKTLALIFSKAGYDARSALSAEAALALLQGEEWTPQLAIIDVHLPGMNGIDLAILLKAKYPSVRVSLFSGRAATADLVEEARKQGHNFSVLPKPVPPTVFLGMAARVTGDEGQSIDALD